MGRIKTTSNGWPITGSTVSLKRVRLVFRSSALGIGLLVGCAGHYMRRGIDLYAEGRYVEAAALFEQTQGRVRDSSQEQQAEYGLYRGANFLSLGDLGHAQQWLSFSDEIERAHPGTLRPEEQIFLQRTRVSLAKQMQTVPSTPAPPTAVASSSQASPPASVPEPDASNAPNGSVSTPQ
jgi:hypothetical protein